MAKCCFNLNEKLFDFGGGGCEGYEEVANYAALPDTGETDIIYKTLDDGKIYEWNGSAYVELTEYISGWQRPNQWLAIPSVAASEEVFYGLYAVWNTTVNPCALLCNGTGAGYTVDWGDGTITDYAFGVKAERNYVYSALSAATEFRGYRQALIKVTPRAGATITSFDLQQKHSSYSAYYSTGFLEKHVMFGSLTSMTTAWSQIVKMSSVENFVVKKHPNISFGMFYKYNSLVQFTQLLPHTGATDNMAYLSPNTLQFVNFTLISSAAEGNNSLTTFPYVKSLKNITLTGGNQLIFFQTNGLTEYPDPANINIGGNCNGMFWGNYCLREIPAYNLSNVTSLVNFLHDTTEVLRIKAYGAKVTHSIANNNLSAVALNEYFTNLGTANVGATLTITGNPGAGSCTTSIATTKGWTIIN